MSKALDDLSLSFRHKFFEFLARLIEAQIPVMIIGTGRTEAEQLENVKNGVSWTLNSKHLVGKAIDVCPYEIFRLQGQDKLQWDDKNPIWQQIGTIGEQCGLTWGGRWPNHPDLSHFEIKEI